MLNIQMVFKKGVTAHGDWVSIEDLFQDNNDTRVLHLDQELFSIDIDDILVIEYYQKLKVFFDLLASIEQPIPRKKKLGRLYGELTLKEIRPF